MDVYPTVDIVYCCVPGSVQDHGTSLTRDFMILSSSTIFCISSLDLPIFTQSNAIFNGMLVCAFSESELCFCSFPSSGNLRIQTTWKGSSNYSSTTEIRTSAVP